MHGLRETEAGRDGEIRAGAGALLVEERTGHAARYALEGMPFPEAVTAMRNALSKTAGPTKAGLIDSLGWRRDTKSMPALDGALSDADVVVASASATALGRIGEKGDRGSWLGPGQSPAGRPAPGAGGFAAMRRRSWRAAMRRGLSRSTVACLPRSIRIAFESRRGAGSSSADSAQRAALVAKALAGQDRPVQVAALKLVRELNEAEVVTACLRQWNTLPADSQLAVRMRISSSAGMCCLPFA